MTEAPPRKQPPASWLQLTITANCDAADAIAAFVGEHVGGVEQIPLPNTEPCLEKVIAYLPNDDSASAIQHEIMAFLESFPASPPLRVETSILANQDWNKTWKEQFKPLPITPHLTIKPTWETYQPGAEEKVIEMDPGMAFGTGHHASTRLALEFIEGLFHGETPPPATVLDVGTGTGILAMAAALFGATQVLAIDNDPEAVTVAKDNIRMNDLQATITSSDTDLNAIPDQYGLVIANIIHDTLIELAAPLLRRVAPGGALILAGILEGEQTENIRSLYQSLGLTHAGTKIAGEWSSLLFTKPPIP